MRKIMFTICTVIVLLFATSTGFGDMTDGLVGYWSFDSTNNPGNDDSGNGNSGIVYGAESTTGIRNNALSFDGEDDYVDIEVDTSSSLRITGALTVSTWFYAEPEALMIDMLFVSHTGRNVNNHWCWKLGSLYGDPWGAVSQNGSNDVTATGSDALSSNTWYHLAMTYEPDNYIKLYLDGDLVGLVTGSSVPDYMNDPEGLPIYIGAFYRQDEPIGHPFSGSIDEVRIYNRALSADEIMELASIPVDIDIKPESCPNPLNIDDKGMISVAVLGTEDFDVFMIDPASIRLAGIGPVRSSYEDVATPVPDLGDICECTTAGPDGFIDLTLKFNVQEIVAALGEVNDGIELELTLTGALYEAFSATPIQGKDCIVIISKGKQE